MNSKQQYFTFTFLLVTILPCLAQPVLNINDQTPMVGETYTVSYAEVADFELGGSGADQTWDYSNTNWATFDLEFSILAPGDGLSSVDFPDADFVWFLAGFNAYNYYQIMDNSIDLIGGASGEEDDILFKEIFTDTEDALRFPATFGDTYEYFSAFTTFIFGTQSSATRNGTVEYDGYGTIITPFGTYDNVLRMVITSSVSTFPGEVETQYAWMLPGQFIPVMVYTVSNDPETEPSVYYAQRDGDTAIRTPENIDLGLRLLTNPVSDYVQLTGEAEVLNTAKIYVFNNFGQRVPISRLDHAFDVAQLPSGQYYLTVVTEVGQQVLPFVKQ